MFASVIASLLVASCMSAASEHILSVMVVDQRTVYEINLEDSSYRVVYTIDGVFAGGNLVALAVDYVNKRFFVSVVDTSASFNKIMRYDILFASHNNS